MPFSPRLLPSLVLVLAVSSLGFGPTPASGQDTTVATDRAGADVIERITRSGEALVLSYLGTGLSDNPYEITLTPDGGELLVEAVAADGLLRIQSTAKATELPMPRAGVVFAHGDPRDHA